MTAQLKFAYVLDSEWARLFANWGDVAPDAEGNGYPDVGRASPELARKLTTQITEAARLIGMALVESPEWQARKRQRGAA